MKVKMACYYFARDIECGASYLSPPVIEGVIYFVDIDASRRSLDVARVLNSASSFLGTGGAEGTLPVANSAWRL